MHWVLQANIHRENGFRALLDALLFFDQTFSVHKVVPFVGEIIPEVVVYGKPAICIGSYSMRHASDASGWWPGVFKLDHAPFSVQKDAWGTELLNHDGTVVKFGDVNLPEGEWFVRPVDDNKVFAGKLFDSSEFSEWQHRVVKLREDTGTSLTPDTEVFVARPKKIQAEYRLWVVRGEIVTASLYKQGNTVRYSDCVDDHFLNYGKRMIEQYQPAEAFVLDVCDTPDGPKIVEINNINSAGFYAADLQKLVYALIQTGESL